MTKILVIEDEQDIREEVMDWLMFEGYDVQGAANGRIGLQTAYAYVPDLILCDIAMPEMDGHGVLIEVRSSDKLRNTPFIFLTADADRDSVRKGMEMGADDYITKPFTHAEVLSAVRTRMARKAAEAGEIQERMDVLNRAFEEEREKRLLKTRLVAMFSHDFRNPLSTVLSSMSIIRKYEERLTPEQKQQHFQRIESSVHLLVQMLDDMLVVAELESGHLTFSPEEHDVVQFVENMVDEFRMIDQQAHVLTFHVDDHPGMVSVDIKLIRQILSNLLANALKYSPAGVEIGVHVGQQNENIRLIVEDHGIGIPADSLDHLFETFHRGNNVGAIKGTGLGLSIVKSCIDQYQGHIYVESRENEGTRITVDLPKGAT